MTSQSGKSAFGLGSPASALACKARWRKNMKEWNLPLSIIANALNELPSLYVFLSPSIVSNTSNIVPFKFDRLLQTALPCPALPCPALP
jgi:hypothetical protein